MAEINIGGIASTTYQELPEFVASRNFTAFDFLVDATDTNVAKYIFTKLNKEKILLKGTPIFKGDQLIGLAMNTVNVSSGGAMLSVMVRGSVYSERLPFSVTNDMFVGSSVSITPREGMWLPSTNEQTSTTKGIAPPIAPPIALPIVLPKEDTGGKE
jgi:hypothetical protein